MLSSAGGRVRLLFPARQSAILNLQSGMLAWMAGETSPARQETAIVSLDFRLGFLISATAEDKLVGTG